MIKTKKNAFLMNLTSLILCVAMLVGSTFAWFTDTVTSGNNKIIAGNLDVELWHKSAKMTAPAEVTNTTEDLFKDVVLWEPGAYACETFTVKNVGNLALKYKMGINVGAFTSYEGHNLTEVLQVATATAAPATREEAAALTGYTALKGWTYEGSTNNHELQPAGEESFTVVIYWAPQDGSADDLYNMNNGKSTEALSIDLGVQLVATQLDLESDSFGNDYDQYAENTIANVIPAEKVIVPVEKNDDNTLKNEVTINAEKSSASVTAPEGTKLNEGVETLELKIDPKANVESGVTVGDPTEESAVSYNISVVGLAADNTVPLTGKLNVGAGMTVVKVYHNGQPMEQVEDKARLINKQFFYDQSTGDVFFMSDSFSPFDFVVKDGKIHLYTAAQLRNFAEKANTSDYYNKKTIVLENNINLEDKEWTQINGAGKDITFDGNAKTISNLKISTGHNAGFFATGSGCTIKNLTVDKASVSGIGRIAVICGHGMCVNVENCTVKNASVEAVVTNNDDGDKAGIIVGYLSGEPNAKVMNCTVEDCTVQGYRDVGALVGYAGGTYTVTGNTAKNVAVTGDRRNNYNNYTKNEDYDVRELIGEQGAAGTVNNNTATDVKVGFSLNIATAQELRAFAAAVNGGNTFAGVTVFLSNDIDLNNEPWTPIGGDTMSEYPGITFAGTFDGQNHTICNLKASSDKQNYACAGLFGTINSKTSGDTNSGVVKNVILENVDITSTHYAGAVVAYASKEGAIINCHVNGGTITSLPEAVSEGTYDNGDKAGGINGYGIKLIEGCSVSNLTIKAIRDLGGIVGGATGNVKNNNVGANVVLEYVDAENYPGCTNKNMQDYAGRYEDLGGVLSDNTGTATKHGKTIHVVPEAGETPEAAIAAAIVEAQSGDTIILPESQDTIVVTSINKAITVKGNGSIKVDASTAGTGVSAPGVVFEDINFYSGNETYNTIRGKVTYKNCRFDGLVTSYDDSTYIGCTFTNSVSGKYLAHVYAGGATYTDCTFNGGNRCVYVYTEGGNATANFTNCSFTMNSEMPDKSAVMLNIDDHGGNSVLTVSITNCTQTGGNVQGTDSSDGPEYNYQGIWGTKKFPKGTVTLDGTVVYQNPET